MKTLKHALLAAIVAGAAPGSGTAQASAPTGWEITGIPALSYNPDDKFGYGAVLQLFNYGARGKLPYVFTLQPTVVLSTGGRRDYTLFFDAPEIGGTRWRADAFIGSETQKASPYYGIGNDTPYDKTLEAEPNEMYYKFERKRIQLTANLQRRIGSPKLRVLLGAGAARIRVDETPDDAATTVLSGELAGAEPAEGWTNYVRAGIVWDTRDRETHTHRGTWADVLVQRVDKALGAEWSYTRVTGTVRKYVPLSPSLTLAARAIVQDVSGEAPFYDLSVVQTSFKPQEGLGGGNTVRGFSRNRFVGRGVALANAELRWRAKEFRLLGGDGSLTLNGFVDGGRVWADGLKLSEIAQDTHVSYGGGIRVGRGPNFVVAVDIGHSKESTAPIYIGLGFLF